MLNRKRDEQHATSCDEVILPVNGEKGRKMQESRPYCRYESGLPRDRIRSSSPSGYTTEGSVVSSFSCLTTSAEET